MTRDNRQFAGLAAMLYCLLLQVLMLIVLAFASAGSAFVSEMKPELQLAVCPLCMIATAHGACLVHQQNSMQTVCCSSMTVNHTSVRVVQWDAAGAT